METRNPEVSLVIVDYKTAKLVTRSLHSIAKAPWTIPFEVIVVSNHPESGQELQRIVTPYPFARVIVMPSNRGFSAGCNAGISNARGKYIFLLNPDAELSSEDPAPMITYMQDAPNVGIVGPKVRTREGRVQENCWQFPSLKEYVYYYGGLHLLLGRRPPGAMFAAEPTEVPWVSGSALLIRRDCLADIGLLDENIFLYLEDTDICKRAWNSGWKVIYYPNYSVTHGGGEATIGKEEFARILHSRVSRLYYFSKHYTWSALLALRAIMFCEVVSKWLSLFLASAFSSRIRSLKPRRVAYFHVMKRTWAPAKSLTWQSVKTSTRPQGATW